MPTIIPPVNTTPDTAYDLTGKAPFDGTIDLTGLAHPQTIWFKYSLSGEYGLSLYLAREKIGSSTKYYAQHTWWNGKPDPPPIPPSNTGSIWGTSGVGGVFFETSTGSKIPLSGTLYIRVYNNTSVGNDPTVITKVLFDKISNAALPAGSIIAVEDFNNAPSLLVSPTGLPTQIRPLKTGENASILENGISLWSHDSGGSQFVYLYDSQLNLITTVSWTPRINQSAPISCDRKHTFYISSGDIGGGTSQKITTVSETGTLGSEWTISLSSLRHHCPSFIDSDIIYLYCRELSTGNFGIRKFHKSTGVLDLPIIIDDDVNYKIGGVFGSEFLVLPDDSLIIPLESRGFGLPGIARRYSSTGTLISTFMIDDESINRVAYAGDTTYTSFWVWSFDNLFENATYIEFRISDGVRLHEITIPTSSNLSIPYTNTAVNSGDLMFGAGDSCPFLITMNALPPYGSDAVIVEDLSGLYVTSSISSNQTLPSDPVPPNTFRPPGVSSKLRRDRYNHEIERKIPDPTIRTALLGD